MSVCSFYQTRKNNDNIRPMQDFFLTLNVFYYFIFDEKGLLYGYILFDQNHQISL